MDEPVEKTRKGKRCGKSLRWRILNWGKFEGLDKKEVHWGSGWNFAADTRVERLGRDVCVGHETTPHRPPATESVTDLEPGCWALKSILDLCCDHTSHGLLTSQWLRAAGILRRHGLLVADFGSGTPLWSCWTFFRLDGSKMLPPSLLPLLYHFSLTGFFPNKILAYLVLCFSEAPE